jgi:hypothetical protein
MRGRVEIEVEKPDSRDLPIPRDSLANDAFKVKAVLEQWVCACMCVCVCVCVLVCACTRMPVQMCVICGLSTFFNERFYK